MRYDHEKAGDMQERFERLREYTPTPDSPGGGDTDEQVWRVVQQEMGSMFQPDEAPPQAA